MKIIRSKTFTGERAWAALDIANMNGITTRLHWTDQPYKWHINDGQEVFVVLDGQVRMHYRKTAWNSRCCWRWAISFTPMSAPSMWLIHKVQRGYWWWKPRVVSDSYICKIDNR
ncbi:cupin domain protein [Pseudomonas chlororaphis subsp. aurantiaca]|nr:cupin domain protein [Pseudomonas chlororaphis subsp. aurantiaca]